MGKDDSCEPLAKKLKQSQLCFKSPKATNSNLKPAIVNGNNSESPKSLKFDETTEPIIITDSSDTTLLSKSDSTLKSASVSPVSNKTEPPSKGVSKLPRKSKRKSSSSSLSPVINKPKSSNKVVSELVPDSQHKSPSDNSQSSSKSDVSKLPIDDTSEKPDKANSSRDGSSKSSCNDVSISTPSSDDTIKSSNKDVTTKSSKSDTTKIKETSPSSKVDSSDSDKNTLLKDDVASSSIVNLSLSSDDEMQSNDSDNATSSSSTPVTPKMQRQMTPKMMKRHEESVRKKQLERQRKEEKRALLEKLKNEKLKQKQEEENKKKQMKEEMRKKRQAELELKNEEKRQKQEDKRLRKERDEEERIKKQAEKLEEREREERKKEEEERKKERIQAAFVSFFKKQKPESDGQSPGTQCGSVTAAAPSAAADLPSSSSESRYNPVFMPFPMKNDMRLAAVCRKKLGELDRKELDSLLASEDSKESESRGKACSKTYLQCLKSDRYVAGTSASTWAAPTSEEVHDCIIIEAQVDETNGGGMRDVEQNKEPSTSAASLRRAKLLQFCENRRPAYFGTWAKSSKLVSGRRPFVKDSEGILDYDVESDSDWEEEEGEDVEADGNEEETEAQEEEEDEVAENGYLLDNTFVPHGYLSDEEQPEHCDLHESVEKQKDRLVALREEFDEEMKQGGAQALKPRLLGCLWVSNSTTQVSKGSLYEVLLGHRAVWDESNGSSIDVKLEAAPPESNLTHKPPHKQIPPLVLQEIARMVEGSRWPLSKLVREVGEVLSVARPQNPVSRFALTKAIKQIASKTLDSKENSVWTIKPEIRAEYNLQEIEDTTPTQATPPYSRVNTKETLLDAFLKGQQPPAKKRISLTPITHSKDNDVKMEVTPETPKLPEPRVARKKVSFVTLPPRQTPGSDTSLYKPGQPVTPLQTSRSALDSASVKPHVDTPRPSINRFLIKDKPTPPNTECIEISDDSNLEH